MTTWAEKNVQDSGALVWNFLYKASSHYIEQSKILLKVKMSVAEFKINLQLNPVMVLADFFFQPPVSLVLPHPYWPMHLVQLSSEGRMPLVGCPTSFQALSS